MEANTLYGSVTRCRLYNMSRQDYVIVDIYTNVVTESLVFASIHRTIDGLRLPPLSSFNPFLILPLIRPHPPTQDWILTG